MSDATRPNCDDSASHSFVAGTRVIAGRELGAYFDSPIAYIYVAVFLVLSCAVFMNSFFLESVVDMSAYFDVLPFLLIPFIPAITMRSWAEEHAQGTFELISTLPLLPMQLVIGKYAAAVLFYLLILVGTLPILFMLIWLGEPRSRAHPVQLRGRPFSGRLLSLIRSVRLRADPQPDCRFCPCHARWVRFHPQRTR